MMIVADYEFIADAEKRGQARWKGLIKVHEELEQLGIRTGMQFVLLSKDGHFDTQMHIVGDKVYESMPVRLECIFSEQC